MPRSDISPSFWRSPLPPSRLLVPLIGAERGNRQMIASAVPATLMQLVLVYVAFAALTHAYLISDFSVRNVFENSHSAKPLLYKISGVWGNHEGSMLLWVFILASFGGAVAIFGDNLPPTLKARVLAVQGSIGFAFLLFIVVASNPFARLNPVPIEGNGLNPVLQDPALGLPSALSLRGLRRPFRCFFLCHCGLDRWQGRCGLGPLGEAVDARRLDVPHHRHQHGKLVGLL